MIRQAKPPPLVALLRAAQTGQTDVALSTFSEPRIAWVMANGLGPLLVRAVAQDPRAPESPF